MVEDPLGPAKGILIGMIAGALLWLLAVAIALIIVAATQHPTTACATGPFDFHAVRDGLQVVRCP